MIDADVNLVLPCHPKECVICKGCDSVPIPTSRLIKQPYHAEGWGPCPDTSWCQAYRASTFGSGWNICGRPVGHEPPHGYGGAIWDDSV